MKAGILTIYDTENLGNRLQNYALQQALLQYADEVVTVRNKQDSGSRLKNMKRASRLSESVILAALLIVATVVLGGGAALVGYLTWKSWKLESDAAALSEEEADAPEALPEGEQDAE